MRMTRPTGSALAPKSFSLTVLPMTQTLVLSASSDSSHSSPLAILNLRMGKYGRLVPMRTVLTFSSPLTTCPWVESQ